MDYQPIYVLFWYVHNNYYSNPTHPVDSLILLQKASSEVRYLFVQFTNGIGFLLFFISYSVELLKKSFTIYSVLTENK